jgi:hypothetical protein
MGVLSLLLNDPGSLPYLLQVKARGARAALPACRTALTRGARCGAAMGHGRQEAAEGQVAGVLLWRARFSCALAPPAVRWLRRAHALRLARAAQTC